jgi:hypothetical protein
MTTTSAPKTARINGQPDTEKRYHTVYDPAIKSSPWAKFTIPITPKIKTSPTAMSAENPHATRAFTQVCKTTSKRSSPFPQ